MYPVVAKHCFGRRRSQFNRFGKLGHTHALAAQACVSVFLAQTTCCSTAFSHTGGHQCCRVPQGTRQHPCAHLPHSSQAAIDMLMRRCSFDALLGPLLHRQLVQHEDRLSAVTAASMGQICSLAGTQQSSLYCADILSINTKLNWCNLLGHYSARQRYIPQRVRTSSWR